jgi:hypothetical protein
MGMFIYQIFLKSVFGKMIVNSVAVMENKVLITGDIYFSGTKNVQSSYNTRIEACNIETGKTTKRKILKRDRFTVKTIVNGIAWMEPSRGSSLIRDNRKILAIDCFTLEKVCGEKRLSELLKINPDKNNRIRIEEWEGKIKVSTGNSGKLLFNCSELSSRNAKMGQTFPFKPAAHSFGFYRGDNANEEELYYNDNSISKGERFNDPRILIAKDGAAGFAVFTFYEEEDRNGEFFIRKMASSGNKLWEIDQKSLKIRGEKGSTIYPRFIGEYNELLIFWIKQTRRSKIFALDVNLGNLKWSRTF